MTCSHRRVGANKIGRAVVKWTLVYRAQSRGEADLQFKLPLSYLEDKLGNLQKFVPIIKSFLTL
jgi:hypothetical protein